MLDAETKRRINTARDILVGKVPDPKSQVEQITIALIYKFMDDMDTEAEELGGKRSFFAGDFEKYSWVRLMSPGLGGYEVLNLYAEAIAQMTENHGIPLLFRDIFKNAYLPYRDPETLKSFLKVINDFWYDHSERLGDAFEYLLSVLGSQGEAGQFRTPRHIIDFMVALIDPQKHESILDPACGTAGFLISAYKHIMAANAQNGRPGALLTPDERARLINNIRGYDISPDMVRLSLVNLYLHGFTDPHIAEYDTLTSDERWNEYADVIMANPPFMSPKGGIRPHKRFSVQSNRSEVLFVDYLAEHLSPNGRAAVIVPEGIIFQSGTAYKALRKMLVENYLVGVISLPAGVFNPYSGVKTSILWMDKTLAKRTGQVLFVKIENDGFELGAQRRESKQNDLPDALRLITSYKSCIANGPAFDETAPNLLLVEKARIAENGEYNLSGERYKSASVVHAHYPLVYLGDEELFDIQSGGTPDSQDEECWNGNIKWITLVDLPASDFITQIFDSERKIAEKGLKTSSAKIIPPNSVIVSSRATIGRIGINRVELATNQGFKNIIIKDFGKVLPEYLAFVLTRLVERMENLASGGTFKEISKTDFKTLQIPLPPLEVQAQIVDEISAYQRIVDGARQVLEAYQPRIEIDLAWPVMALGDVIILEYGKSLKSTDRKDGPYPVYGSNGQVGFHDEYLVEGPVIIVGRKGSAGAVNYSETSCYPIDTTFYVNILDKNRLNLKFCFHQLRTMGLDKVNIQAGVPGLNRNDAYKILFPLPDLATQERIVAQIEREQALVKANKELIVIFEQKIKDRIAKVWGE